MSENQRTDEAENAEPNDSELTTTDFDLNPISSAETIKRAEPALFLNEEKPDDDEKTPADKNSAVADERLNDPIFAALAVPRLPALERENRARLLVQSPTRLYFYWRLKNNAFQTLRKAFGGNTGNYQLIVKLVNETRDREELHAVEAEGDWWFNVEANARYRAEIGFYATNRPFVRVLFSNTVETPRKSPSPRPATESQWAVSSAEFAEILDDSGFTSDAFEVALAGDDAQTAEIATRNAFQQLTGERTAGLQLDFGDEEIRFALLALASGVALADLRGQISASLFAALQENAADLSAEQSLAALREHFDVFDDEEIFEREEIGSAVFGASLIHFPKQIRKRISPKHLAPRRAPQFLSKLAPVSS